MDERWIYILNLMETILILLTAVGSIIAASAAILALNLAKKYLPQHSKKLEIEDFFNNRNRLFSLSEKLKKPLKDVLWSAVMYNEISVKTDNEVKMWQFDEEIPVPIQFIHPYNLIEVFYNRTIKNSDSLVEIISEIESLLIFINDEELKSSFNLVRVRVNQIALIPKIQYDYKKFTCKDILNRTLWPRDRKDFEKDKWVLTPWEENVLKSFKFLDFGGYDETYTYQGIMELIKGFQKNIMNYLERKIKED